MKIQNDIKTYSSKSNSNCKKTKPLPPDSIEFQCKNNEAKFVELREEISKKLKPLVIDLEKADWDFYTNSTPKNQEKSIIANDKYTDFYNNEEIYRQLKEINDNGGVYDKKLKKQLKHLTSDFGDGIEFNKEIKEMSKKESEIAQNFNSYTMTIDDKPVTKAEISKILETEKNPEIRQKALNAKIKSGDLIADDLVELVKMRNDFARKKGYENYFDYKISEVYDIEPKDLDKLLSDVAEKTKYTNKKIMDERKAELAESFGIKKEDLRNYHYGYLTNNNPEKYVNEQLKTKEEIVDISKKGYKGMGYNIDKLPITLDLFPRENKNTHGFSFGIEPGKDARILANLTNNVTSLDTLLHELGHSVFTIKTNPKLPFIEQDTTATMTEAVAMMMGDLSKTENLLRDKVSEDKFKDFQKTVIKDDSNFVTSSMTYINFEKEMYKNPDQNLKQLWKDMNVKYRGRSDKEDATNEWATIPHYLSHPAYYQNYFRASLIKVQLYDALKEKFGNLTENKDTANYLNKNLFQYGSSKEDNEILESITGKPLGADAFCNRINSF